MKITITAIAGEKLNPGQYESIDRQVHATVEIDLDDSASTDSAFVDKAGETFAGLQMMVEGQMYAALARAMASRGQKSEWLRNAAIDRSKRIESSVTETIEQQCEATGPAQNGVLS